MPTVLVTQDQEEAAVVADSIAVMQAGRIIQRGPTGHIFHQPRTRFVAEFVGFDNFIPCRIVERCGERTLNDIVSGLKVEVPTLNDCSLQSMRMILAARSDCMRLRRLDRAQSSGTNL